MHRQLGAALAAIACVATIAVATAQTIPGVPADNQLNPGRTKAGGGNFIVIGCVSREGQGASLTYLITDYRQEKPAPFRLEGDRSLLRVHVGHTVEVGGPVAPPAKGSSTPTMKVESLTYIATTCVKR